MFDTRPPAVPDVLYSENSPVPKSSRSPQKKNKAASVVMPLGNAVFWNAVEQFCPKNRMPLLERLTVLVVAPNPVNVNPSGMLKKHVSSPRLSMCVHPLRSSTLYPIDTDALISFPAPPAGPCAP